MIIFSLLISLSTNIHSAPLPVPAVAHRPTAPINKTLLLQLVNKVRQSGCQCGNTFYPSAPPLTWNPLLEKAALKHSTDMLTNKYFSHTANDGSNAGVRLNEVGYSWKTYGENIAQGYQNEREVVAGWINSAGHCKNMLMPSFTEMGVAKAGSYWTQVFATSRKK